MQSKRVRGDTVTGCIALAAVGVAGCSADGESATPFEESLGGIQQPLKDGSTTSMRTSLTCRTDLGNSSCFLVSTGGSTTRWALTVASALPIGAYTSSDYKVRLQNDDLIDVEKIYPHPLHWWPVANGDLSGATDPVGRVDVALMYLASAADVDPADEDFIFGTVNQAQSVTQESRIGQGMSNTWSWVNGSTDPHVWDPANGEWGANTAESNIRVESGDQGGPLWSTNQLNNGNIYLEAIQSEIDSDSEGLVVDSSSFQEWVQDAIDCGPFDPSDGDSGFCTSSCKCDAGEGDCDSDSQCKSGLTCIDDIGDRVGLPSNYDLCGETSTVSSNSGGYCESIGGCWLHEGDCNSHDACKGNLVCRQDVGKAIGMNPSVDVCDAPRTPETKPVNLTFTKANPPIFNKITNGSGYCTSSSPCVLGDGDCNNDAGCRGYLKCAHNVGCHFGFNDAVDVCVLPDVKSSLEAEGCP